MNITAPCVVSLTWLLSDAQNAPIDELTEPTEFLYGGDDLLPKVEEALAEPQIVGRLACGQKFHPASICMFMLQLNSLTYYGILAEQGFGAGQCPVK